MEPIGFKPGVFYPFTWLEEQLAGTVSLQQFLTVLDLQCTGRNRLFQNGLFGDEILLAIQSHLQRDKVPETASIEQPLQVKTPGKRGRPRLFPISAKIEDLT